jgi:tRNA/tmRNA/rRNA uracil-C5-methylase (TrmA/RlmC/RlmD family)
LARCVGATGQVVGVEASDEMVQRGTENAKQIISQVEFFSQDLTKDFSHHSWAKQGFDALLIDPPRQVHMKLCNMYLTLEQKESFMFHVIQQHWQGMRVYWHNMVINLKKRQ